MPLQKQKIPISFAEGLDTKTDSKQVLPTKLLELQNGVFQKTGKISKRFGYDILLQKVINESSPVDSGSGLARYNDELILFDGTRLLSFLDANEQWINRGKLVSLKTTSHSIIRNPYQQSLADFASDGTLSISVWEDSRGGCRYSVFDERSENFIVSDVEFTSTGERPRVFSLGNDFVLTFVDANSVKRRTIPVLTPATLTPELSFITDLDPVNKVYDGKFTGNRIYFVWNSADVGGSVRIRFMLPTTFTASSIVTIAGEEASVCAEAASDCADCVWFFYYNGTELKAFNYNRDLDNQLVAPTVIETVADVRNITSVETDSSTETMTVLYEIENTVSGAPANFVKTATINKTPTVSTSSVFNRGMGLASKAFSYNNQQYCIFVQDSELQSTYFVLSLEGDLVSKISTNVSGGYTAKSVLPAVVETSTGKFKTALLRKIQFISEDGNAFSRLGVEATELDFTSPNNFLTAEQGNNLHIVGGTMQMYDGISVVEHGFSVFPEGVSVAEVNPGAGSIANGQYQYSVVYAWIDNQGQLHRSAPSIPETITVSSGPSDVQLTMPTLRITKKQNVFLEVYRTEAAGTIFYKVTSVDAPIFNDKSVDTVTFTDDTADANLISNELLYTTGGVLENIAPPACSLITTFKSRIFINDQDQEDTIRFSKIRREGFPVEFNDTLVRNIDARGGALTALEPLDDKLIIFKENAIYYTAGEGPNNLGLQDDYFDPLLVTTDVGCIDANSVVETPLGLMFQSAKGIYLLNRSLGTQYIGAEVEDFNDLQISSAVLVANSNEVRFTTTTSVALVYNYFYSQWSTFTNHESTAALNYENKYTFVKSNGKVYQQNNSRFNDGGDPIRLKLSTAWIAIASLTGFQRAYKAMVLGSFKNDHRLLVKVGYDFNEVFTQEVDIDVTAIIDSSKYGDNSNYGDGDPLYGGKAKLYEFEVHFKKQKCQAIRISLEDVQDSEFAESFDISALVFLIGGKQGMFTGTTGHGAS